MLRFEKVVLFARRSARTRNRIARSLGVEGNRIGRSFGASRDPRIQASPAYQDEEKKITVS